MQSHKWMRIMKFIDLLCLAMIICLMLFGPRFIGDTGSKVLAFVLLFLMFGFKLIIGRQQFVCPHCGGKEVLKDVARHPKMEDVMICPHCGKEVMIKD